MSATALVCRTLGHAWDPVPQGRRRRAELFRLGQTELRATCRCSSTKTQLIDLDTWDVISTRIEYPKEGYLILPTQAGTGRLPRSEARKAAYVRVA